MGASLYTASYSNIVACVAPNCALRAPTAFSVRIKSASVQKTKFQWRLMREARYGGTKTRLWLTTRRRSRGFHKDCRLRTDALFIRAQSAIRADGPPSAQDRAPLFELPGRIQAFSASKHCALCAPTVFLVRMKSASVPETRLWIKPKAVWIGFYARSNLCNNGRRDVSRHA
jgi:hypothetical protein